MRRCNTLIGKSLELLLVLLLLVLVACGTLEAGIERTPTPDADATATLSALQTDYARLATQVAAVVTPGSEVALGKVAYVQGGDIWVKELADGEPRRLTTDGRNLYPQWSPSGEWLAFRKGEQVWLASADDGSARALDDGAAVDAFAWSPVANRIAYVTGAGTLEVTGAGGGGPTVLVTQDPGREIGGLLWSPDGDWIAYEWRERHQGEPPTYQGIWKVNSRGGEPTELYNGGAPERGEAILAQWSPDGAWILFWQSPVLSASILADGVPLYALPAEGGEPVAVLGEEVMLPYRDFVEWSADGSGFLAVVGSGRQTWDNKRIAGVGASEPGLPWAMPNYITEAGHAAVFPSLSPRLDRMAYSAMPSLSGIAGGDEALKAMMERSLYVRDAEAARRITDDATYRDERPQWSPDGSHILFARLDGDGRASLWLVRPDGSNLQPAVDELTPAPRPFGYYGYIDWDALFDWWREPVERLERAPSEGSGQTITPTPPPFIMPTTTPSAPAPGTDAIIDCADVFPGLPGCLRAEPLADGRLAFVEQRPAYSGRPVVADLEDGVTTVLGEKPARIIGWSPSGERLLVAEGDRAYRVYRHDGTLEQSFTEVGREPFWAPRRALLGAEDWLAVPRDNGSVWAVPFFGEAAARQVLPASSLGEDGQARALWSANGWLAWTPTADQLARAERWEQDLFVRRAEPGTEVATHRLSGDIRQTYYELIDWVPGTNLILAGKGVMAASFWVDGAPLVAVDAETGGIRELGATMLLTREAYDWHPTQPGLLALAEGGGRSVVHNKRLALLDIPSGNLRYLIGPEIAWEMACFEPAWSPDGNTLAYAAGPASPEATGEGAEMEKLLNGRAIYLYDGEARRLTDPGEATDGWPRWSADGSRLLYTRQDRGRTDVRVATVDGSSDELLLTGLEDPMCYYGGCGWGEVLAYRPKEGALLTAAKPSQRLAMAND